MNRFRIAAPFTGAAQVGEFKEAGADELYCGFTDAESERSWPAAFHLMNHRGGGGSFTDPGALQEALAEARRQGLPVYVTFNSHYTEGQYRWLLPAIEKVSGLRGCAGIIVTDIALLLTLRRRGYAKAVCMSTGGTTFNTRTAGFFRSLGVSRVILDRQLSGAEIAGIAARCGGRIDLEIFVFHGGCMFVDGYCMFFHCRDAGSRTVLDPGTELVNRYYVPAENHGGCMKTDEILTRKAFHAVTAGGRRVPGSRFTHAKNNYPYGCNLCALYDLAGRPLTLKVVGRGEERFETVRAISRLAARLGRGALSRGQYMREAKKIFAALSGRKCNGYQCYFPPRLAGKGI